LEVWRQETVGDFRMRLFPGGHFFLDTARDEFLAALSADLAPLLGD
jgi:surfactin synthase thioesterase subunit